jgi:hypothetical protein
MGEFAIEYVNRLFGDLFNGSKEYGKEELLAQAGKSGASEKFLERLRLLRDDQKFSSVEAVMKALDRVPID